MTSSRTTVSGSKREILGLAETTNLLSPALPPPRGLGGHLALQQVDTQPKEDLSWFDSFAKQQAQLLLLNKAMIRTTLNEQSRTGHLAAWLGRTLDLSKAYKQLAILPQHSHLAVVAFR